MFVDSKTACEKLEISKATLHNWKKAGKIEVKITSTRKVKYNIEPFIQDAKLKEKSKKLHVIYGRVSTSKQNADLKRQLKAINDWVLTFNIDVELIKEISDVASGMNENRKGLKKLLEMAKAGSIDTIYISYKDRLTRFGFGYLEYMFNMFNVNIKVLENDTKHKTSKDELTEDLISIIHHFSMKMYSNRKNLTPLEDIENFIK